MNIYYLQRINRIIKSNFLKNSVLLFFHIFNRRYLSIYLDPVLGCNLKCQSCYFSNEEKRKELKGTFLQEDLPLMAKAIFGRTMRLQIGCGAEPTLFKYNHKLIELGKKYGIQYISMTTNANLLSKDSIIDLLHSGLDELTISIHGITKGTYEDLMTNASFEKLIEIMQLLEIERRNYPTFKLRLNYTINNQNVSELRQFFEVFGIYKIDFLQLRALRDLGGKIRSVEIGNAFNNELVEVLSLLKNQCKDRGVIFIPPINLGSDELKNESKEIKSFSYIYISPMIFFHPEFDWKNETFNQFSRRTFYTFELLRDLFFKS